MRRYAISLLLGCVSALVRPEIASADVSAVSLGLNRCTIVSVAMTDTIDSATAHPGDFFRFKTVDAVLSGSTVVIPPHTLGYGIVVIASPAGRGGRAGTLVLEPRYLVLDGHRLGVVLNNSADDLERNGSSGSAPGYLGALPVPGVGAAIGAFNYFHHGKDIDVPKGTLFSIFPSDDPSVETCQGHPIM
ncbi:MAG: hypothetical protein ACXVAO_07830 [Vulcanimicrobiaceae bacterium]